MRGTLALVATTLLVLTPAWEAGAKGKAAKPPTAAKDTQKGKKGKRTNQAPSGANESELALQRELDQILGEKLFSSSKTGVYVVDMTDGRVLYSYDADAQLNPASNVKLVATATALEALGPDFTYDTTLLGVEPDRMGVVRGDVWMVGMGDPTLRDAHLAELAEMLAKRGVKRITGAIIVAEDAERDVLAHPRYQVVVSGAPGEGKLGEITVTPDSAYFVVENSVVVTGKAPVKQRCRMVKVGKKKRQKRCGAALPSGVTVTIVENHAKSGPQLVIKVSGKIRPGMRFAATREAPHPAVLTGHSLRAHMKRVGIVVEGNVRAVPIDVTPPAALGALAVHKSVPLRELVAWINKPSNNFLADRLIRMVGARVFGGAPTFEKGVQAMVAFLDRAGVRAGSYLLENGSGLSYANHMSAREVVAVLMHGAKERWAKVYLDSLAIAGVDGTLKHRFGGFESAGYVRGKTGTLTGVSALSGFVTIDGQHTLCFAILNNGFNNKLRQSVRAGQARMADALYRHLRRVDKQKVAPVTTPTIQPPPDEPLPPDEPPEASPPADPVEETAAAPGAAEVMVPETVETPAPRTP